MSISSLAVMTSFPIQMHPNTTQRHKCFSATLYIWTMFFGYLHMHEQKNLLLILLYLVRILKYANMEMQSKRQKQSELENQYFV